MYYNMIIVYNEYIAKMVHAEFHLSGVKIQNFPGGACPQTPLA